ncbi:MAG: TMEM175 family protein [Nocardioidaceae bacterium]
MRKGRVEAFSDGVIAILITIMVLALRVPTGSSLSSLRPLAPVFFTYVLSFVNLGIYWNNHHHLLQATERINGAVLWTNLHLLFWLSLFPFVTGWMGENHFAALPTAVYGGVMLLAAIAYYLLQTTIIAEQGKTSALAAAIGRDVKGKVSPFVYASAIPLAFVERWVSVSLYVVVALMWLVPDRRLERGLEQPGREPTR